MFESIQKTVIETVASHLGMNPEDITPDTSLTTDLKVDSLDFVEICIELEDNYGITFDLSLIHILNYLAGGGVYYKSAGRSCRKVSCGKRT